MTDYGKKTNKEMAEQLRHAYGNVLELATEWANMRADFCNDNEPHKVIYNCNTVMYNNLERLESADIVTLKQLTREILCAYDDIVEIATEYADYKRACFSDWNAQRSIYCANYYADAIIMELTHRYMKGEKK